MAVIHTPQQILGKRVQAGVTAGSTAVALDDATVAFRIDAVLLAIGIVIESSVSFVGLVVQPPQPSWGNMLADARNYLFSGEWWMSVFPGACISLSVIAINLLGYGLRDVLDPRHRTSTVAA